MALAVAGEYVLHHAAPILRRRVIDTLSARFGAPVQLDTLDISLVKGIAVEGSGLRIPYRTVPPATPPTTPTSTSRHAPLPAPPATAPPISGDMLTVDHFTFRATWKGLLHSATRVSTAYVDGMTINLPAGVDRSAFLASGNDRSNRQPAISLLVDEIRVRNFKLILGNHDPAKEPREFDINQLVLHDVGQTAPFTYEANLVNPIPRGDIHATGHFGPWDKAAPRQTPLDGNFTYTNVDLSTIRGLRGKLTASGSFSGPLDHITVDGTTDTPNFALDISDHPQPLRTHFHAIVDGTIGDTYLQPVDATLNRSSFTCSGQVVDLKHIGHDIALDVTMQHGHIEDLLAVGMKSNPPSMRSGIVAMKAKLEVPPGKASVAEKIRLAGQIGITGVAFSDSKFQDRIDDLSARAQGHPHEAAEYGQDKIAEVNSAMSASFSLANGQMLINSVQYSVPGAEVQLDGAYTMNNNAFEFKGHVRTQATASQMVTGWKSLLLKPVDPFLKKHGAGLELPISISGVGNQVQFGLAFKDANETPQQMRQDIRNQPAQPTENRKDKKKKHFSFSLH